jgi:nucleoside-diphosphate-sugar epimerase
MDIVIAGAHGAIARHLTRLLAARGDRVRGLIRSPAQEADVQADGGEPVLCDLETITAVQLAGLVAGADAVVFAAGAGPGSGPERKLTLDRDGAIRLIEAAQQAGVGRYVMVSAVGAEDPPEGDDVFAVYLQAKAAADTALEHSALAWTILRPGRLTDDPGTGMVRLDAEPHRGEVPREDVAAVLDAVVRSSRTVGRVIYVNAGDQPVGEALDAAVR